MVYKPVCRRMFTISYIYRCKLCYRPVDGAFIRIFMENIIGSLKICYFIAMTAQLTVRYLIFVVLVDNVKSHATLFLIYHCDLLQDQRSGRDSWGAFQYEGALRTKYCRRRLGAIEAPSICDTLANVSWSFECSVCFWWGTKSFHAYVGTATHRRGHRK